jgi:hypothetical protein
VQSEGKICNNAIKIVTSKQGEEYRLVNIDTVRENRHFVLISPVRCVFSNPTVRPDTQEVAAHVG